MGPLRKKTRLVVVVVVLLLFCIGGLLHMHVGPHNSVLFTHLVQTSEEPCFFPVRAHRVGLFVVLCWLCNARRRNACVNRKCTYKLFYFLCK